jgi:hypothetical protein
MNLVSSASAMSAGPSPALGVRRTSWVMDGRVRRGSQTQAWYLVQWVSTNALAACLLTGFLAGDPLRAPPHSSPLLPTADWSLSGPA